jgi:NTP pyrophosphatase (non-canonical NTP hydrolase)
MEGTMINVHDLNITNWGSIRDTQAAITQWADEQFPTRAPDGTFKKFLGEMAEFAESPNASEFADMIILLFDLASMYKIDIPTAVRDKMLINVKREWVFNTNTGMAHHVKSASPKVKP